jgi:hypothetical protein
VVDGGGGIKGEFSYPLLPYLSKKVISPYHLKIMATPLFRNNGKYRYKCLNFLKEILKYKY